MNQFLKFDPILKEKIWGGEKLVTLLQKASDRKTIGESWELSDVEGDTSVVTNGALNGKNLRELIQEHREALVGTTVYENFGDKFPLLIKFIDAKKALEGVQLPIAGFRGSGLAWMVDILSGVITGAAHGGKVRDPFDDFRGPQNVGHLFLAIKPNIFIGKNYIRRIKENLRIIKKLPRAKGFASISYPGENKAKRFSHYSKKKINLPKEIKKDLNKLISASS